MESTVKLTEFPTKEISEEARAEAGKIVYDNSVSVIKNSRELIEQEFGKSNTEWIKCSDRLPEEEDMYLVSGKMKYSFEKEYEYFIDFADYRKDSPYEYMGAYGGHFGTYNDWYEGQDEYEILAWMPLPDPLEE